MHILKVKDEDGVWHDIPAIVGPQGPAGVKGDKGDKGNPGTTDYSDLSNKPQINNHTLSGNQSAADLGLGTYSKPSGGIPASDMTSAVQASLGKADTALQQHQDISGKADKTDVGDLTDLDTTDKSSLVAAVNEVNGKGLPDGGNTGQFLKKTSSGAEWAGIVFGINLTGTYVDPNVVVTLDPLGVSAVSIYSAFNNGKPVYLVADLTLYYPSMPATPVRYPLISVRRYGSLMYNYEFVFAGEIPSVDGEATITFSDVAPLDTSMSGVADVKFGYVKPSGGIPATDLASAVQTSLGKADSALQSYTETDPTVPNWAKAANKPSYTASEVGAIAAPSSPATGAFLVWNGSAWTAQTLSTWQGGSY